MQHNILSAWIALHRTPGLSSQAFRKLFSLIETPEQAWLLAPEQLDALGLSPSARKALKNGPNRSLLQKVDQDLRLIEQQHIQLLPLNHPDYPALLKETADPPPLLYVKGAIADLQQPQIAMVGSRRCSRQGAENAIGFARQLAQAGMTVTSGGALGIDTQSHLGALATENGRSIGVLGTGIDVVYPRRNRKLFAELQERGALVSEFPLGTQPHRALFPQRNRLISGLSLGVLVVEAALKSGSLITARFALEQGREVFAIPGSIHNPDAEGCHYLIQQGAKLAMTAADIMTELQGWLLPSGPIAFDYMESKDEASTYQPNTSPTLNQSEQQLLQALGHDPANFDLLLARTGWSIAELQSALTALEIKGLIEQCAGRFQRLTTSAAS